MAPRAKADREAAGKQQAEVVKALMARHGRTYSAELGLTLGRNSPSMLFRWLCASLLFSARIGSDIAVQAVQALAAAGWTTPRKLCEAGWEARVRVLNQAGYARYDESTSRMLGESAALLLNRYGGDLRKLRDRAGGNADEVRRLLQEFKGLGPVGADIFCREAQAVWPELFPAADAKALRAAERLGLGGSPQALAALVQRRQFPRLLTALVRSSLAGDLEAVRRQAAA